MEAWPNFFLNYRGKVLTLQDYQSKPRLSPKRAVQLELLDAIKKLEAESIEIEILEKAPPSSVKLGVRINFRNR
jgi:hypothetical protein